MQPTQNPVSPADQPQIAGTLRRAALYLIRYGWTQDNHYDNASGTFPAADILGALTMAVTGHAVLPSEIRTEAGANAHREYAAAMTYLVDWLALPDQPGLDDEKALRDWNDLPWLSKSDIINGLLGAAADIDGIIYRPGIHTPYAVDFAAMNVKPAGAR